MQLLAVKLCIKRMVFLCSVTVLFFCFVIAKLCKEKKDFFKLICDSSRCMFYNKMWKGAPPKERNAFLFRFPKFIILSRSSFLLSGFKCWFQSYWNSTSWLWYRWFPRKYYFFSLLHWWAIISLLSIVWDTDINYEKGGVREYFKSQSEF